MRKTLQLFRSFPIRVVILIFLVLLAAPGLAAQGTNPRFTLFGGGSFLRSDRTFPAEGRTFDSAFASGGMAGVHATLDVFGHLSVEGTYSYGTNNLRVTDLNTVPPEIRSFGVRLQRIDANILYFLTGPQSGLRPFATFGFGIARLSPTNEARKSASTGTFITGPATLTSGNKFDFNYGFGLEKKFAPHLGFRLDFRDHVMGVPRLGVPPGAATPGADFYPVTGIVHDVAVTAGIVIYASK
jgi:hypothetical protein